MTWIVRRYEVRTEAEVGGEERLDGDGVVVARLLHEEVFYLLDGGEELHRYAASLALGLKRRAATSEQLSKH